MDGSYLVGIDCRLAFHFITDLVTKKQNTNKKSYVLEIFDEKIQSVQTGIICKIGFFEASTLYRTRDNPESPKYSLDILDYQ